MVIGDPRLGRKKFHTLGAWNIVTKELLMREDWCRGYIL